MIIQIHHPSAACDDNEKKSITRRLSFALGRFAGRVRYVNVILRDENGDKGGLDTTCRILAKLQPRGEILIENRGESIGSAAEAAIDRLARAVSRTIERANDRRQRFPFGTLFA